MTEAHKALKALPCFKDFGSIATIPMNGGYSQSVFKVLGFKAALGIDDIENTTSAQQPDAIYVAKRFNKAESAYLEAEVADYTSNIGIGLAPLYYDDTWLISVFAKGPTLAATQIPIIEKTHLCLDLVSKFHQTPLAALALPKHLNVDNVINYFVANAQLSNVTKALFWKIISEYNVDHQKQTHAYIHGDTNFANVVFTCDSSNISSETMGKQAKLIDFEAVSRAPVAYELGMLNAINTLPLGLIEEAVKASGYFKLIEAGLVTRYSVLSCVINGLWFLERFMNNGQSMYEKLAFAQFNYLDELTQHTYKLTNQLKQMR